MERTKFEYIVASLSPDTATELRDLILSPPTTCPYMLLRQKLIRRTPGSNQQKLQRLLNEIELGDRKPSQLLRHMRQLWMGDDTNDSLLRLPTSVCMVLAPSGTDISLDNLAEMADHIMEVSVPSVSAVHVAPTTPVSVEVDDHPISNGLIERFHRLEVGSEGSTSARELDRHPAIRTSWNSHWSESRLALYSS